MVLHTYQENSQWLQLNWKCSFLMQWQNILHVAKALIGSFQSPELLVGDRGGGGEKITFADNPPEKELLVLRGESVHFKSKISITFHTGTNDVSILIPKSLGLPINYKSLAIGVGPFMDNIELRMYKQ